MLVKCQICKNTIDRDTAYKRTVNGHNKYYCSEDEFNMQQKAKTDKDLVYKLVCDILGVQNVINTILFKEWTVWNSVKSNDIIASYLRDNKDYLSQALRRISGNEYNRIRYLSAILKNNLQDYVPHVEKDTSYVNTHEEVYETKYKAKIKTALEDIEGLYHE